MSRDTKKYWYAQVGIPRTETLDRLQQEANMRGVPYSTHIADLLIDRDMALYGECNKSIWFPRGVQVIASPPASSLPQESDVKSIDETTMEENLDAFLGFAEDNEE